MLTPETGQVLDHNAVDFPFLYRPHHLLEIEAVKVSAGVIAVNLRFLERKKAP